MWRGTARDPTTARSSDTRLLHSRGQLPCIYCCQFRGPHDLERNTFRRLHQPFAPPSMFGLEHLALRQTFNKRLTLAVTLIAISQFNFGFDQQGYSATQAMDPFIRQFGRWDAQEEAYVLPPVWLSFFNGFNYLGQATGGSASLLEE